MDNKDLEEIVKEYKTEHEVDVFKIENNKYYVYQFNSTHQKYKEFPKQQFIDQLINWMSLDLKELKLIEKFDKTDHSEQILKLKTNINFLETISRGIN
jgi:hypothetical protein